jgi:peptide/nickel transport system substrate-binding protein
MKRSYWEQSVSSRVSRRRALAFAGSAGAATALLAACGSGGSSSKGSSGGAGAGLLTKPVDTTKQAKRGGLMKLVVNSDVPSLDVQQNYTGNDFFFDAASRLVAPKVGYLKTLSEDPEGDIAESFEYVPERLQINLKLRSGIKWQNVAPVNGRPVDVDDILFTWKRFVATGGNRAAVANSVNPDSPFVSYEAPDSRTIVIKLASPVFYNVGILAAPGMFIMPKEADDLKVLDARNKIIGTGPFILTNFEQSVGYTLKRNPDYYNKDLPFPDQKDLPIVPSYATRLSQFRAGGIFYPGMNDIKAEDILPTKHDVPELGMFDIGVSSAGQRTIFGWKTAAFRDERVRQAISMSWDRDLWIDTFYNTDKFIKEGLAMNRRWNTALSVSNADADDGWWLDPNGKDFGPNAKYFKQDLAEAKKLMAAAGFANGLDAPLYLINGGGYENSLNNFEVLNGFQKELGFRYPSTRTIDYNTEFLQSFRDSLGDFEGLTWKSGPTPISADPVARFAFDYYSKGGRTWYGYDAAGKGDHAGDTYVDDQITKAQREVDADKRRALVHDLQRYLAKAQYGIRWPGGATSFDLAWPALANYNVWRPNNRNQGNLHWWVDDTKAPLKKS